MSKIKEDKLTISMNFSAKQLDVVDKSYYEDILNSPIYKVDNLYYQYLKDLKLRNYNDASDFSAAFMTF